MNFRLQGSVQKLITIAVMTAIWYYSNISNIYVQYITPSPRLTSKQYWLNLKLYNKANVPGYRMIRTDNDDIENIQSRS